MEGWLMGECGVLQEYWVDRRRWLWLAFLFVKGSLREGSVNFTTGCLTALDWGVCRSPCPVDGGILRLSWWLDRQ